MKKLYIYISFLFVFGLSKSKGQQGNLDVHNYMYSLQFINSAAISANDVLNGASIFRTQWQGFEGAPISQFFDVNAPLRRANSNVGLTVFNDKIGVSNRTDIQVNYVYKAKLDYRRFFALSISPVLVMGQSNFTRVQPDFNDLAFSQNLNFTTFNARFGFYLQDKDFFVGASVPRLFVNKIVDPNFSGEIPTTFEPLSLPFLFHGGYFYRINKFYTFKPSFLVRFENTQSTRIDLNLLIDFQERFGAGINYRTQNNLGTIVYAQLTDEFKFSYCFNYGFGPLRGFNNGTHELQIIFGLFNRKVNSVNMPKLLQGYKREMAKKAARKKF